MGSAQDQGSRGRRWLTASLGTTVNALFERDPASRSASYFARGAVGINRPASLPTEAALSLSASLPELDMDGWEKVGDGFPSSPARASRRPSRSCRRPAVSAWPRACCAPAATRSMT